MRSKRKRNESCYNKKDVVWKGFGGKFCTYLVIILAIIPGMNYTVYDKENKAGKEYSSINPSNHAVKTEYPEQNRRTYHIWYFKAVDAFFDLQRVYHCAQAQYKGNVDYIAPKYIPDGNACWVLCSSNQAYE